MPGGTSAAFKMAPTRCWQRGAGRSPRAGSIAQRPKRKGIKRKLSGPAGGRRAAGAEGLAPWQGAGAGGGRGTMRAIAIAILRPLREINMFYYHVYYFRVSTVQLIANCADCNFGYLSLYDVLRSYTDRERSTVYKTLWLANQSALRCAE